MNKLHISVKSFKESYVDDVNHNIEILTKLMNEVVDLDILTKKLSNSIHYGTGNVRDFADSLEDSAKKLIELSKQFKNQED